MSIGSNENENKADESAFMKLDMKPLAETIREEVAFLLTYPRLLAACLERIAALEREEYALHRESNYSLNVSAAIANIRESLSEERINLRMIEERAITARLLVQYANTRPELTLQRQERIKTCQKHTRR